MCSPHGRLGMLHDRASVEGLIGLTASDDALSAQAAAEALIEITRASFGTSTHAWMAWWAENKTPAPRPVAAGCAAESRALAPLGRRRGARRRARGHAGVRAGRTGGVSERRRSRAGRRRCSTRGCAPSTGEPEAARRQNRPTSPKLAPPGPTATAGSKPGTADAAAGDGWSDDDSS